MRKPIKVEEAIRKVMEWTRTGRQETVPIKESLNRVLAKDLTATNDVPWFKRSPYDGYAIFSGSTAEANADHPVLLEVLGTIGAGYTWDEGIKPDQAVKIMTGAAIPDGADAVIMVELTKELEKDGKIYVQIKRKVEKGENIVEIGEDMKKGEILVPKGTTVNPGVMATLATFGYQDVPVMKKPKAAIIATGSELLEVDEPLEKGKIRNSNAYMLWGQVIRAGGEPVFYRLVKDDFNETYEAVKRALGEADIVMTTGGVSVGDFDYIPKVYEKLGAELLFNKVAMRPGSVTSAAVLAGKILFGLSGNPSACYVGFELFVRPYLKTMLGHRNVYLKRAQATLGEDFPKPNPFTRFVRAKLSYEAGVIHAGPVRMDKSNIVSSLIEANALIVLPGGSRGFTKGLQVDVLLLEDEEGAPEWDENITDRRLQRQRENHFS
ncbi:molybdopterin molybdenumtransferase [Weizmannia acidilactici]|mgnify:CR=1 FL=1|uniref:Molybdopterin molybdenumtransferase n=1 Tax=Weizmannia acidilactici TaxID=2607726 RepID=A0A5J4JKD5_9BACI|nr:gephyrin-like molybdotransferase Glp [Weizmannia acidilactici]GER66430.1 molybdopterin molybdenumtransferase [Weizmannia acidilactici]GER69424.1 molybdopterin molybdenumtransferase [Weizmannia acidilactici]GER72248.1 molybdopterin molybdenumtransferase [Weizmannia acidilactici]